MYSSKSGPSGHSVIGLGLVVTMKRVNHLRGDFYRASNRCTMIIGAFLADEVCLGFEDILEFGFQVMERLMGATLSTQ